MERHDYNPESPNYHYNDDAIDLGQVFIDLLKGWKTIVLITTFGVAMAVSLALLLPREYQVKARVSMPDAASIERLKLKSLVELTDEQIFAAFIEQLESTVEFNRFVTQKGFLEKLYPNSEMSVDNRLAEIDKRFAITPVIPDSKKREADYIPRSYNLRLAAPNEVIAADLLNSFILYSNKTLVEKFEQQNKQIIDVRLADIERQIMLLRHDAKLDRERAIQRKEEENQLKITQYQQQKALLVELAASNRVTQIAEVKEALKIATELNIINPTPIDEFAADNKSVATSIKLTSSQNLPLYLMGTRYLHSLSDTLVNRKSDELFLKALNELNKKIEEAKNDPLLMQLKNRTSDDLYIDKLPMLLSERNALLTLEFDFDALTLYSAARLATVSGKATKPNRPVIVGVGLVLSFLLSIIFVMLQQTIARRKKRVN